MTKDKRCEICRSSMLVSMVTRDELGFDSEEDHPGGELCHDCIYGIESFGADTNTMREAIKWIEG